MKKKIMPTIDNQEDFWRGQFGDQYIERNRLYENIPSLTAFFVRALKKICKIDSIIEFGPNIGLNLIALKYLFPNVKMSAVEINKNAIIELKNNIKNISTYHCSIFDFNETKSYDLVLTKGFLIHIKPNRLKECYNILYKYSKKYILIAEYYSTKPTEIIYRNYKNVLFKRDFAGEMLDQYSDLTLIDYGFVYRRDNLFPDDDINWFLLKKK